MANPDISFMNSASTFINAQDTMMLKLKFTQNLAKLYVMNSSLYLIQKKC